jgi:hypothetical protein
MENELIIEKSWWNRNWKWFLPTLILFLILFGYILSSTIDGSITDIAQAYSDNSLYEKAIDKAKIDKRVLEIIGEIEPIDQLAILEGNAIYSNYNNSVTLSIRIKGNKGKGKMDITAERNGTDWNYKKINIRIKEPKEEIQIIKDTLEIK